MRALAFCQSFNKKDHFPEQASHQRTVPVRTDDTLLYESFYLPNIGQQSLLHQLQELKKKKSIIALKNQVLCSVTFNPLRPMDYSQP